MLGDAIGGTLPLLRAQAESLMQDTCRIDRQRVDENGDPVRDMDPVTLELTEVWDEVHSGPCRAQRRDVSSSPEQVAGEFEFEVSPLEMQLPIAAVGIKRMDRVTITAATFDPELVGVVATVLTSRAKTHATKRELICKVVG